MLTTKVGMDTESALCGAEFRYGHIPKGRARATQQRYLQMLLF